MSDLEGEMLDAELRSARRALLVLSPCIHCRAVPEIIARDEFGRAKTTGWPLVPGCPDHNPDWPARRPLLNDGGAV